MRHLFILIIHFMTTVVKLVRPGGVRAVVAESVLAKHQVLILALDSALSLRSRSSRL